MNKRFKFVLHKQKLVQILLVILLGFAPSYSSAQNPPLTPINVQHLYYFGEHMQHLVDPTTGLPGTTIFPSPLADGALPVGTVSTWDSGTGLWSIVEPQRGVFDWAKLDEFVNLVQQKGAQIIHTIGCGTPTWASARPNELFVYGLGGAAEPNDNNKYEDYRTYLTTLFTRYKGKIQYYNIWNEPSFSGPPQPNMYANYYSGTAAILFELHMIAAKTLHAIDPNAKILAPSFIGTQNLDQYLQAAKATGLNFTDYTDYISYDYYSTVPEDILNINSNVKLVLQTYGIVNLPIINTESGYVTSLTATTSFGPVQVSAANFPGWLARDFIWGLYAGFDKFMYYSYDAYSGANIFSAPATSTNPPPGALTAAGIANATIANWLTGATMGNCYYAGDSIDFCEFTRYPWGIARIIWRNDDNASNFTIPSSWGGVQEADNLDGVTKYNLQGALSIPISGLPLLVKNTTQPWVYNAKTAVSVYTPPDTGCYFSNYNYPKQIQNNHPLMYYKFNSNSNAVINDYSGNGNNGLMNINYPPREVPGALYQTNDGALDFNPTGLTEVAAIQTSSNVNPWDNDFSIEFWSKEDDFSAHGEQIGFGAGDYLVNGFRIGPNGNALLGKWSFWTSESGGGNNSVNLSTSVPLSVNTWYHIVITHRASDNRTQIFVNGLPDAETNAGTYFPPTAGSIDIGADFGWNLYGALDEVAIYNYILPNDTIQAHYQIGSNNCYFIKIN